ncbi:MAG: AraC family transcriptional regulator [Opitutales bacterium]
MRASRHHQIISGYFLDGPVEGLPALTHCGDAVCSARHRLQPHAHTGYEFVYLSRGQAFWKIGSAVLPQRMGDLLITYPRELHATGPEPGVEFHLLWIGVDLEKLGREGQRLAALLRRRRPYLLARCHELEALLRGVFAQAAADRPLRAELIALQLRTFAMAVEQRLRLLQQAPGPGVEPGPYGYATNRALAFMRENLDRAAGLAEIAAAAGGGSVPRFAERFRREFGVSPGAQHLRLRLDAARQALSQPDARVTDVALRYGFSSSQHFSTAFRRWFGRTPRGWQRGEGGRLRKRADAL